jgi:arylsulfatase A-like enzyme
MRNNYRDGKEISDQSLKLVKNISPASFFLYLQYFDPHLPYMKHPYDFLPYNIEPYKSSLFQEMTRKEKKEFFLKQYLNEVKFADEQIGRLIKGLKNMDLYDKTIIILTSDHGEQLFEHGKFGHSLSLYNEEIKIPLIIKGVHNKKSMRISDPVSIIDIPPTILDMVAIDSPASFEGTSLKPFFTETNTQKNRQPFSMAMKDRLHQNSKYFFCQINNNFKYIIYSDRNKANTIETGKEKLYDLKLDQYEKNNIIAENDKIANQFRAAVWEKIMKLPAPTTNKDLEIDDSQLNRLKALGYLQ